MMTRVYISCACRDKAAAEAIAADLTGRGADVYLDTDKSPDGQASTRQTRLAVKSSDQFLLLVSPQSARSKWVRAEVAWALHSRRPIIPVMLKEVGLGDLLFLAGEEVIDFTGWPAASATQRAMDNLARRLSLGPRRGAPPSEEAVAPPPVSEPHDGASAPRINHGDLADLFSTAAETAHQDPERALYLYRHVLDCAPQFVEGNARDFVEREELRLKAHRVSLLEARAKAALTQGDWDKAERIGRQVLLLDQSHADAKSLVDNCIANRAYDPLYQHAIAEAKKGHWMAAVRFVRQVAERCPTYGDPERILAIRRESARFLRQGRTLPQEGGWTLSAAFSPDGSILALGSSDKAVKLWQMPSATRLATLTDHEGYVRAVAFSPDGSTLASGSDDRNVILWNMPAGRRFVMLRDHTNSVFAVAFSPDGSLLASGSVDGTLRLREMLRGTVHPAMRGHRDAVYSVSFSPDGTLISSGSADTTVRLWRVSDRRCIAALKGHGDTVCSVAFSPRDDLVASACADRLVRLWPVPKDEPSLLQRWRSPTPVVLSGHSNTVNALAFSPDGSLLASVSADRSLKLWSMPDGELLASYPLSADGLAVAFSPDALHLVTTTMDRGIQLWQVDLSEQ